MVQFGEQNPCTKDMLREGDEESEVEGLMMTPEVLNPSPEGFSTTPFLQISHHAPVTYHEKKGKHDGNPEVTSDPRKWTSLPSHRRNPPLDQTYHNPLQ